MKSQTKVGLLFIFSIVLVVLFGYFVGAFNPFSNAHEVNVAYNFAGGIEVGSPVRVMGIKVGRVKSIDFSPNHVVNGEEVKLKIRISVDKSAWETVRADSRFFINLAGVIGEKFIEISPGSADQALLKPGQDVRGEDPPRIDQLISQSYGLAGKIMEIVESNEGSFVQTIETMNRLVLNFDKVLKQLDKTAGATDVGKLLKNLTAISGDLAYFSNRMRGKEGEKTIALIHRLIWRLEELDKKAIKKFLQEEGIKAKLF